MTHICKPEERYRLHDARGIFCCYVCDRCVEERRQDYRSEIFTDPNYDACEAIEVDWS